MPDGEKKKRRNLSLEEAIKRARNVNPDVIRNLYSDGWKMVEGDFSRGHMEAGSKEIQLPTGSGMGTASHELFHAYQAAVAPQTPAQWLAGAVARRNDSTAQLLTAIGLGFMRSLHMTDEEKKTYGEGNLVEDITGGMNVINEILPMSLEGGSQPQLYADVNEAVRELYPDFLRTQEQVRREDAQRRARRRRREPTKAQKELSQRPRDIPGYSTTPKPQPRLTMPGTPAGYGGYTYKPPTPKPVKPSKPKLPPPRHFREGI